MEAATRKVYEIAVVESPGADASSVAAWGEVLHIANQAAMRRAADAPRLIATRWTTDEDGTPMACAGARPPCLDRPRAIALPDERSTRHLDGRAAAAFAHWLQTHHASGTTIAACNGSVSFIDRHGLLQSAPPLLLRDLDHAVVEDVDGIVTAIGSSAWIFIALRMIHRVYGSEVMGHVAGEAALCRRAMIAAGLHHFAPDFSHGDSAVLRAQRWLHGNLAVGIDLDGMCRASLLKPRTLQRRFSRATGTGPIKYAQHLRISYAQRLILRGVRIRDVHNRVGYTDSSAFRRIFHRISGCSPSKYIRYVMRGGE
ncbi:AraC family transcriptional regulator [Stenotrophomonas maltophilia]|uniref:AraC family transcriptional regulator n=2 Tax=Stenotrophomonas maltophilia TaxID=40324 RepID=A0A270NIE6_STEMA|nr:AraC family transcriptional regulator [Stenotrophomonas maltophilia]PAM71811.1 AraC family transcriptional regulator [Stenotrophomonas maltophilia]